MTTCRHDRVLKDVRSLFDLGVVSGLTDGQLLDRFTSRRGRPDETAFSALVDRHGPMVLRVCRNALGNSHDVDDAFQATFLILVRKAGTIRNRSSCGSWLHGVALRAAAEIRCSEAKRKGHEAKAGGEGPLRDERVEGEQDELRRVIDEELGRLRDRYRTPLVLCYLEGRSCEEAANQLGWPLGTVKSRLARGRERLRAGLVRRGLAPALGLAVNGLPKPVEAAVPASLGARVVEAAGLVASGSAVGAISAAVGAIVKAEMRGGLVSKGLKLGGLVVGVGLVAVGGMLGVGMRQGSERGKKAAAELPAPKAETGAIHARVLDRDGKGVGGVEVRFWGWKKIGKVRADGEGRVELPRAQVEEYVNLATLRSGELAWGGFDNRVGISGMTYLNGRGTVDDPVRLTLQPLTHKVEGKIVDTLGKGIAGARVVVSTIRFLEENIISAKTIAIEKDAWPFTPRETDGEGRYSLMLPEMATAYMKAIHPEYIGPDFRVNGDTQTIDRVVLIAAGAIRGTVSDSATGKPISGVRVGTQRLDLSLPILGGGGGENTSDDKGQFAIRGLQPGVYNLLLGKIEGREKATAKAQEAIRVRAGEDTTADLRVIEGRRLEGVVIDSKTDKPAVGLLIGCYGPAHPLSGAQVEVKKTDKEGRFVFYVPAGKQHVYVMEGNSLSRLSRRKLVVPEHGEIETVQLVHETRTTAQSGQMQFMAVPDVQKEAAPAKAKDGAKKAEKAEPRVAIEEPAVRVVTGRVSDGEGKPVVGVQVYVDSNSPDLAKEGRRFDSAATDQDGLFVLRGLPRQDLPILLNRADDKVVSKPLAANQDTVELIYDAAPRVVVEADALPDEPVPKELRKRLTLVDLDPRGTEFLADGPANQNDLARLPQGVRRFDGTFFKIGREMIHLRGRNAAQLPGSVAGIGVNARADRIEILHATQGVAKEGTEIGSYLIHYDDGTSARIPIVFGRNVTNWWVWPRISEPEIPIEARVAWKGSNDTTDLTPGMTLRLFRTTWRNPHPEKGIVTLDMFSTNTECDPFLVGVTLERDKGEAPR